LQKIIDKKLFIKLFRQWSISNYSKLFRPSFQL